jgi:hypothetical protein
MARVIWLVLHQEVDYQEKRIRASQRTHTPAKVPTTAQRLRKPRRRCPCLAKSTPHHHRVGIFESDEYVISADEKTSIQARRRKHATLPAAPNRPMLIEHEYDRCGAWAYIAALDVHHARIFGRCEITTGIAPFDRLVEQVMTRPPYNDARRVFWIVDNGSSHRGAASVLRLKQLFPRLTLVHGPVHASWLNQIEIYFSIVQRKILTPNDFAGLDQLAERLLDFQSYWESTAKPFEWKFTKADLATLLAKLSPSEKLAA